MLVRLELERLAGALARLETRGLRAEGLEATRGLEAMRGLDGWGWCWPLGLEALPALLW